LASQNNRLEAVQYLCTHGMEVDGFGKVPPEDESKVTGETALMYASAAGSIAVTQFLISRGANVNRSSKNQMTPLIAAAAAGHVEICDILIRAGANINWHNPRSDVGTALYQACAAGSLSVVSLLLQHGAKLLFALAQTDPSNDSFLHTELGVVCSKGLATGLEIVPLLLRAGANVNAHSGPLLRTALMLAAEHDHAHFVQLLAQSGADIDQPDVNHFTALMIACQAGHINSAWVLLMSGADVNIENSQGYTPLNLAVLRAETPSNMMEMLVQFGANPNGKCARNLAVAHTSHDQPQEWPPVLRFASDEHRSGVWQGLQYRQHVKEMIEYCIVSVARAPVHPSVSQTIRDFLPGEELPNDFQLRL